MPRERRYFTLEQASAVARAIRPLIEEILNIRHAIMERKPQVWPILENAAGNGGSKEASEMAREFQQLDSLVREIQATGAILKDINNGLVDFPAMREGREVYLCWQYGEQEVIYWHEIEAGFAGRQLWI